MPVKRADIIFVGPASKAIELMGDKARAKDTMIEAGVPCIPGYQGEDQKISTLTREAEAIGYPVMLKASAGGGGRGMRLVMDASQLAEAIETARSEAVNAFGSGQLILEKAIARSRHVEVQIFGDAQGHTLYLWERDCSIQRRHQKIIEEAPCPVMTPELRQAMGEAAVTAARAVDYVGAGTVEFLLGDDRSFYFLEMNTRLQVEHPVTEAITGLDLVALQLRVAAGETLEFAQKDIPLQGHAMEVRLYAEDPANDFLPSTGQVNRWLPPSGTGIRVDDGIESGGEVSPFYDPMLAKIIAQGRTREDARRKLVKALGETSLAGPASNRDFLIDALQREAFMAGEATTAFIDEEYGDAGFSTTPDVADLCLAALAHYKVRSNRALAASPGISPELLNWSTASLSGSLFIYKWQEGQVALVVQPEGKDSYLITLEADNANEQKFHATMEAFDSERMVATLEQVNRQILHYAPDEQTLTVTTPLIHFKVEDLATGKTLADSTGDGRITAPMHGQLLDVLVSLDDEVVKGQRLAVLEAMKMQHEIIAEVAGTVMAIHAEADTQVKQGSLIMEISPDCTDRQTTE